MSHLVGKGLMSTPIRHDAQMSHLVGKGVCFLIRVLWVEKPTATRRSFLVYGHKKNASRSPHAGHLGLRASGRRTYGSDSGRELVVQ